ncbi:MAG: AAA family ATPase [Acidimicrobiales bacterium]
MRVVETHISVLVFLGDRVYKLRKPVHFGFLDFTDRTAREADCRREVELNRRLAPDVYLGVADIVMDGEPVDHMVVMRSLPGERRLAALVRAGADLDGWLHEVAVVLAVFHAGAERSATISQAATPAALAAAWGDNFEEVGRFVGSVLEPGADAQVRSLVQRWLVRYGPLLDARIAAGRVCDGHGDVQAEDVFCLDDGVRILDCIEFSDRLRYGDVCADVAFLVMDLERLGRPDAAGRFVSEYESLASERFPAPLLHHYVAQRAYVRAKVACLEWEQGRGGAGGRARQLHALALRHLRLARPALVLVGGLPGTGKSTLAAGLAARTRWRLLRSDVIRRQLQPDVGPASAQSPTEPGTGRYAPEAVGAVYAELVRRARRHLERGEPVILDASWIDTAQRAAAGRAAEDTGSDLIELCCSCDDAIAAERIRRRQGGDDVSDATPEVRHLMAGKMSPWPSATVIDTSVATVADVLSGALGYVAG